MGHVEHRLVEQTKHVGMRRGHQIHGHNHPFGAPPANGLARGARPEGGHDLGVVTHGVPPEGQAHRRQRAGPRPSPAPRHTGYGAPHARPRS
ncbi:hypothetical protein G6F57_014933 [Rhizopus arrhizus]|uniref:Uncharacterized protein n=1 Tax=Rhizopus delemar TaxID=936053 RepID=A0A9P7CGH1_9FUNG|nr:hypothetical protein G6F22_015831 [Rhizopus arrhizus]KAG1457209.1 hypothetical protein G6F57_014933 [Rhizopus arrhizus]KAG1552674.1 hypothetical protein G6F50_013096 [Rhizopus delemar]